MFSEENKTAGGEPAKNEHRESEATGSDNIINESATIKVERLEEPKATALITLGGFLQRREANELLRTVNLLMDEGIKKVVFDMSEVNYANSSAIGAFVNCASSLKALGGQAVLLAMKSNIKKVFDTLGLAGLFWLTAVREEALGES